MSTTSINLGKYFDCVPNTEKVLANGNIQIVDKKRNEFQLQSAERNEFDIHMSRKSIDYIDNFLQYHFNKKAKGKEQEWIRKVKTIIRGGIFRTENCKTQAMEWIDRKEKEINDQLDKVVNAQPHITVVSLAADDHFFSIKNQGVTSSVLTAKQAGLLFTYLTDRNVIVKYKQDSLERVLEVLFGKNGSGIRKQAINNIQSVKKSAKDLEEVKSIMEIILLDINEDIKKCKN